MAGWWLDWCYSQLHGRAQLVDGVATIVMVLAGSWRRLRVVPYIMIDEKKVDFSHRGDEGYYLAKLKWSGLTACPRDCAHVIVQS